MGISIAALEAGKKRIHTVEIDSIGDSVMIRELSTKELENLLEKHKDDEDGSASTKALWRACITDDMGETLTEDQVNTLFDNNPGSVLKEISEAITRVHGGAVEEGES